MTIAEDEIAYLLAAVNRYTRRQLERADVLSTFSGVRPLYDDNAANPSAVTRDYVFDVDGAPPMLSVFGGKITTYRKLAEHALQKLKPYYPQMRGDWTAGAHLPGGDIAAGGFDTFLSGLREKHPWLAPDLSLHYARLYGTMSNDIIGGAKSAAELGRDFGGGLHEAEVNHLRSREWALSAEDILFRRTKLGLHVSGAQRRDLQNYLGA